MLQFIAGNKTPNPQAIIAQIKHLKFVHLPRRINLASYNKR
jgi:hypothetical protein